MTWTGGRHDPIPASGGFRHHRWEQWQGGSDGREWLWCFGREGGADTI